MVSTAANKYGTPESWKIKEELLYHSLEKELADIKENKRSLSEISKKEVFRMIYSLTVRKV